MDSFEKEVKKYFNSNNIRYIDNSNEYKLPDFIIFLKELENEKHIIREFFLEIKEKRQKYNITNWNIINSEDEIYTFIVDELSCRKILAYSPFSGLLVRNNIIREYFWFSILDLFLMPKKRVNRQIRKNNDIHLKGKLLLDFRNAKRFISLQQALIFIHDSVLNRGKLYTELNECYGSYFGETISLQGAIRSSHHWDIDINRTR